MSKRSTLQKKDAEAASGKLVRKGSALFSTHDIRTHGWNEARYDDLLQQNKLLFTINLVKDMLEQAFQKTTDTEMADEIDKIMDTCRATENTHFCWFANLLENHYEGVIAHASIPIASGKIEGINQRIKTIRRQSYGLPDDEYFFLKVIDSSHRTYERNPKAHKFLH